MRYADQLNPVMPVTADRVAQHPVDSTQKIQPKRKEERPAMDVAATAAAPIGITLGSLKNLKDAARSKMLAEQDKAAAIVVTAENIIPAWNELVGIIAGDKMVYRNALQQSRLVIDGENIHLQADVVSIDFLKTERIRILDFFKRHYRNERINVLFEVAVNDLESKGEQVMSTREIFEDMATRNPNLRILKDKFGMDMEY